MSSFLRKTALLSRRVLTIKNCPKRFMPVCTVDTNLKNAEIPQDFCQQLTTVISKTLDKPEELISVALNTDVNIIRAGNNDPNLFIQIWSVGVFDEVKNQKYTEDLYKFLLPHLNIPAKRIAIFLHPLQRHDAAHLLYADKHK